MKDNYYETTVIIYLVSGIDHLEHFDVSGKRGYGIFPK